MPEDKISMETKPKLAFLGTGWIGLNRMKSLLDESLCEPVAIFDPVSENLEKALDIAPAAIACSSLEEIIDQKPDGIVIATPSALHSGQSMKALSNGIPVFCQKPLARNAVESKTLIDTAERNNCLLGTDFSYRFTDGIQKIYNLTRQGEAGNIYAVDLIFHNAYGPDKPWFYDPKLSGGGCLIDLGLHLVDLALWILDFPGIKEVHTVLMSKGKIIENPDTETEDYAVSQFITEKGTIVRIACSWNLPAGKDAEIGASFYGTKAAFNFANVNGSFYDFETSVFHGTNSEILSSPPDNWGGKALIDWTKKLRKDKSFDKSILNYNKVAELIDRMYGRKSERLIYESINDY